MSVGGGRGDGSKKIGDVGESGFVGGLAFDEDQGLLALSALAGAGEFVAAEIAAHSAFFFGFVFGAFAGGGDHDFTAVHLPSSHLGFFADLAFFEGIGHFGVHRGFSARFERKADVHHIDHGEAELEDALFFGVRLGDLGLGSGFHRGFVECVSAFDSAFFACKKGEGESNGRDQQEHFFHRSSILYNETSWMRFRARFTVNR